MCGHVGVLGKSLGVEEREIFSTLLFIDQLRGPHATGVLSVNKGGKPFVYKRALEASDFMRLQPAKDVIFKGDVVLAGHNRYATIGDKDCNAAHPFCYGDLVVFHNGTLSNHRTDLLGAEKAYSNFASDSDVLAHAMSKNNPLEVIESAQGSYALVWYNEKEHTMNFARNSDRPLFLASTENAMFWGSEELMLQLAIKRSKRSKLVKIESVPEGTHMAIDLKEMEVASTKFTPKKKEVVVYASNTDVYSGKAWPKDGTQSTTGNAGSSDVTPVFGKGDAFECFPYDYFMDANKVPQYRCWSYSTEQNADVLVWVHPSLRDSVEDMLHDPATLSRILQVVVDKVTVAGKYVSYNCSLMGTGRSRIKGIQKGLEEELCEICAYPFYEGNQVEHHENAGHYFHVDCIESAGEWAENTHKH